MSRMVTGDQDNEQRQDDAAEAERLEAVERGPVTCSCEWRTMDTGNSFYSRIVKADPKCKVHPPGWGWGS